MAEEQELRIIARLDDQATAGLVQLQRTVREMAGGQQATAMEGMRRAGSEVVETMKGAGSAMSGLATMIPLVSTALVGMAAAFVASGISNYAESLVSMGRAAQQTGASLAQFKQNVRTLREAGLDEGEAIKQLQAFADFQVQLADQIPEAFDKILRKTAALPGQSTAEARQAMVQFLDQVQVAPQAEALNMVLAKSREIYQQQYEEHYAAYVRQRGTEEGAAEYSRRMAEDAARGWLGEWNLAISNRDIQFQTVTAEQERRDAQRLEQAQKFTDATRDLANAWSDIKSNIGAAFVSDASIAGVRDMQSVMEEVGELFTSPEMQEAIGALTTLFAQGMRVVLELVKNTVQEVKAIRDAFRAVEAFFQDPGRGIEEMLQRAKALAAEMLPEWLMNFFEDPGQGLLDALDDFAANVPRLAGVIAPIRQFFEDPGQALNDALEAVRQTLQGLIPREVIDFFNMVDAAVLNVVNRVRQAALNLIPPEVIHFFNMPAADQLMAVFNALRDSAANLIPQFIRDFWNNPTREGFYRVVNEVLDFFQNIGTTFEPIMNFFREPGTAFTTLINTTKEALANMLPAWARKLLGLGGEPGQNPAEQPQTPTPNTAPPTPQPGTGPQPTQAPGLDINQIAAAAAVGAAGEAATPAGQQPIVVAVPTPTEEQAPPPADELDLVSGMAIPSFQTGGQLAGGRPYVVGEGGPELMVPQQSGLLASAGQWGLWGAGKAAEFGGLRGAGAVGHAVGRTAAGGGGGFKMGDLLASAVPGIGALESIMRDAQSGHGMRSRLRGMLGIEDPGEPAPWQEGGSWDVAAAAGDALDRSLAQQVNVSGVGRISVDVNAPPGTRVNAEGEGLFKQVDIARQTQMLPADYGPAAATGINAGAGEFGT